MVAIRLELLLFLNILYVTDGVRRITNGKEVDSDKTYVVYLVKAPDSIKKYDAWLCGGALVSPVFIITSAACVADVEFMYAIAGYKMYVPDSRIETNECTRNMKKKVIRTCVPMKYELDYNKVEQWSFIDIALVEVESPYDLNDTKFLSSLCSYIPTVIQINYSNSFQNVGTDTLVYGWGHRTSWRKPKDVTNYNQPTMQYATSKIIDKRMCKRQYKNFDNMSKLIDQYMICTLNQGEFNAKGEYVMLNLPPPKLEGCGTKKLPGVNNTLLLNGEIVPLSHNTSETSDGLDCEDDDFTYQDLTDATRRGDEDKNQTSSDLLQDKNRTVFNTTTRKNGICQNDHGGPLVTWVGGREILIGVASVFRVSNDFKCKGPYLYTSTQCNGAFLHCILTSSDPSTSRRARCDSPPVERGYDTVEKYISWEHHPSGPANNERNAIAKHEIARTNLKSTQALQSIQSPQSTQALQSTEALQKALRFEMLVKMVKDQSTAILRQQRQCV